MPRPAEVGFGEPPHPGAPAAAPLVAVTGATGFVGAALCRALSGRTAVRALVRTPSRAAGLPSDIETVQGDLDDDGALRALVDGAAAVVHVAGLIAACRPADFAAVNALGTERLVRAMLGASPPARILLVSSLAARRPSASAYAASKRAGENIVAASGLLHCVVRPPVVYGPGDRPTLPIFQQLSRGLLVVPRVQGARFSLLYIDDLVALLGRLLQREAWAGEILEPDDGHAGGYAWAELAAIASAELARPVRCVAVPKPVVWAAALAQEAVAAATGRAAMLSRGKLGELWYPDWVSQAPRDAAGWSATVGFAEGFRRTLAWYREHDWL